MAELGRSRLVAVGAPNRHTSVLVPSQDSGLLSQHPQGPRQSERDDKSNVTLHVCNAFTLVFPPSCNKPRSKLKLRKVPRLVAVTQPVAEQGLRRGSS